MTLIMITYTLINGIRNCFHIVLKTNQNNQLKCPKEKKYVYNNILTGFNLSVLKKIGNNHI